MSWFTLGIYSVNLDKCIVTYMHHYSIQSIFTALKILSSTSLAFPVVHTLIPTTDLFTFFSFAFLRLSYIDSWNHICM